MDQTAGRQSRVDPSPRSLEQFPAAEIVDGQMDTLEIVPPDPGRDIGRRLPGRRHDVPKRRQAVVVVQRAPILVASVVESVAVF